MRKPPEEVVRSVAPGTEAVVDALMSDPAYRRHRFIEQADPDRLVAAILRLAMEVTVLRDRLDAHESILARHGIAPDDVDAYQPTTAEAAAQRARRDQLIARLVRDLA